MAFLRDGLRAGGGGGDAWVGAYERYRANLGRAILLGLELLVAADIVGTVAPTAPRSKSEGWQGTNTRSAAFVASSAAVSAVRAVSMMASAARCRRASSRILDNRPAWAATTSSQLAVDADIQQAGILCAGRFLKYPAFGVYVP